MRTRTPLRHAVRRLVHSFAARALAARYPVGLALALVACGGAKPGAAAAPTPDRDATSSGGRSPGVEVGTEQAASPPATPVEDAATVPAPAGAKSAPAEPGESAVPPLPKGTRVLHIGDSMAGALGIALNDELKAAGLTGILRYQTASFIPNWAGGREIGLYMVEHDPDLVLVTLGTNEMRIEDPSIRAGAIRKLVSRLSGRPCVWVAPPLWGDIGDTGLLPIIRANCAPCVYLDTTALYPDMPRLPDKTHPTMAARKEWAHRVVEWLARARDPRAARPWDLKRSAGEALAGMEQP